MKQPITVIIPHQEFKSSKYIDHENCYLAEALKLAGYKEVSVGPLGNCTINGIRYHTEEGFGYGVLKRAFEKGESVTVTLI